ncbi:unnamed protein product, partial [Ectocarpus sp. 12 AP-2014]
MHTSVAFSYVAVACFTGSLTHHHVCSRSCPQLLLVREEQVCVYVRERFYPRLGGADLCLWRLSRVSLWIPWFRDSGGRKFNGAPGLSLRQAAGSVVLILCCTKGLRTARFF